MLKLGYKLMSEEHGPLELVQNARRAEQVGFDFAAISDHFHPWLEAIRRYIEAHHRGIWIVLVGSGAYHPGAALVGILPF